MVLDESVLIRLIGSPEIMHDQLVQVAELGQRPYVSVQVIPASHGANAGLGGGLSIATGDGSAPDVLYMDAVEGQTTEKRSLVRQSAVVFERIRGDALSKSQSRELLLRLAEEKWKS